MSPRPSSRGEDVLIRGGILGASLSNGITIIANTDNALYSVFTGTLTQTKTGITLLNHGVRGLGRLTGTVRTRNNITGNCAYGIVGGTGYLRITRRIVTSLNPYSVLIGNTNNGGPQTGASGRFFRVTSLSSSAIAFFSLSRDNIRVIFGLGFVNALLPARTFTQRVINHPNYGVVGVSDVGTCLPLAGVPTCSNSGTTIAGFAR